MVESSNTLLFEMRVLNDLRKLKPEQRKELVETLEREEKLDEEALKKNPNLHVENKIQQVLTELKDLRNEIQLLKQKNTQIILDTPRSYCELDTTDEDCECPLLSFDWWPTIIFVLVFLFLLSMPTGSIKLGRPNPLVI